MPRKPDKFKNLNQVTVKKQVLRTSPYVKPAFGSCTEAQDIRMYLKEMELMKNHPDPKAQEALNSLKSGKINIFAGPLVDNTGKEIIPAGKSLDDGALWGMNYYLKGVNGKIPG